MRHRRAADMHVEDVHEDRDPLRVGPQHSPVSGTDQRRGIGGGSAVRVPEEPEREQQEQERRQGGGGMQQQAGEQAGRAEREGEGQRFLGDAHRETGSGRGGSGGPARISSRRGAPSPPSRPSARACAS